MKQFVVLPKLQKGDRVSIISPSADLAGRFPWVTELGLKRLHDVFGLKPVEYPTTRKLGASLEARAQDIMAAFEDKDTKAVIATLGGDDQIKLLKHLNPEVIQANPKPFFGYSDNTHLQLYLWNLGIPSYYGGCLMTQFGMEQAMHDYTVEYLNHAFFDTGDYELKRSDVYNDISNEWANKDELEKERVLEPNNQWFWDGHGDIEGTLWGGCLESMVVESAAGIYFPKDKDLDGTILFIESADGNTDEWIADYILSGFGERGWLDKFQAVLVGRAKAWELNLHRTVEEKTEYRKKQREQIVKTIRQYNKTIPIIQNLDFGHTDPQAVLPNGGRVRVRSGEQRIFLQY